MNGSRSGLPIWRQIADTISSEISTSIYAPGQKLPTESELATRFGVNRHTVRRAVASLQDAGLLRVEQGRGTFVQEEILDYPLSIRTRFSEILARQARTPSGTVLRAVSVPSDAPAAAALNILVGSPVALIETAGQVDGSPLSLATHHFPLQRFPDLFEAYEETRKITPMLSRLGVGDYFRKSTKITARLPDGYEMRHLRLARMMPVLCLEAVNVDSEGHPIEYCMTRFAANKVQVVVDNSLNEPSTNTEG